VGIKALNEPGYMEVIAARPSLDAASTRCLLIKPGQACRVGSIKVQAASFPGSDRWTKICPGILLQQRQTDRSSTVSQLEVLRTTIQVGYVARWEVFRFSQAQSTCSWASDISFHFELSLLDEAVDHNAARLALPHG